MKNIVSALAVALLLVIAVCSAVGARFGAPGPAAGAAGPASPAAQDQRQGVIRFGIDLKMEPLKLAVADFALNTRDAEPLTRVFNDVLWNDLNNSGILSLVSKSFYPQAVPGREEDVVAPGALAPWGTPPTSAQSLAFGNTQIVNNQLLVNAFLYDIPGVRRIVARRYVDASTEAAARAIAHRFADAIIEALGGGTGGIAESKVYFCRSTKPGIKDIWVMDYDGANARPITQYNDITMTPAVSPDGSRLAFTTWLERATSGVKIYVFSLASMQRLQFVNISGSTNTTPAWSPDGNRIAYSASFEGNMQIYVASTNGSSSRRLTNSVGVNTFPAWNPKTGAEIAFESSRGGKVSQIYLMDSDGANVRKLSAGEGDAVTPAWAPNGQVIAFSWTRGFAPGNYNIFLMDVVSGQLVQLTHGAGRNEHPSFSPDGRHIVFESDRNGKRKQIFTMLADGTQVRALTSAGENTSPVWSAH